MALRGEEGWNICYSRQYGDARWKQLKASLAGPVSHVALVNEFMPEDQIDEIRASYKLRPSSVPYGYEYEKPEASTEGAAQASVPENDEDDVIWTGGDGGVEGRMDMPLYFLDAASVIAALCLDVQPGEKVLDTCAAPGGKSLVLAMELFSKTKERDPPGLLLCNEFSKARAHRLRGVLSSFLPQHFVADNPKMVSQVMVTSADASSTASPSLARFAPFDKILIDAPCSTDRHLLRQKKLPSWSGGVTKANADRQLKMLLSAVSLLKEGGTIVYSTCALSAQENDGVVEKFLKKARKNHKLQVLPMTEKELGWVPGCAADPTEWGTLLLPDRCGFGPIFLCKIKKLKA